MEATQIHHGNFLQTIMNTESTTQQERGQETGQEMGQEMGQAAGAIARELRQCLDRQREASLASPNPTWKQRRQDLQTLKRMISEHQGEIVEAINRDYGNRSRNESRVAEIVFSLDAIAYSLKHLRRWMAPQHRHVDALMYPGAKNRVIPQPLGVVGVIVPWNFPVQLTFSPLASIFAAGNRAMVKMSENSRELSRLLIGLVGDYFPPEKLMFFEETGTVGIEFSQLPFDHLLFTGSGRTGRAVMAAAAKNLTPVTLELGGKSPAVIGPDYPLDKAVERIMFAKLFNAGQVCVNVDYIFVPENRVDDFVTAARDYVGEQYPDIGSPDYTSIIDARAFERLQGMLEDARDKGATLINLAGDQPADEAQRKLPPHLVLNAPDDSQVMQREIFGPIMPVIAYREASEVVDYVSRRDRPLAFYPFSRNGELVDYYLERVMSGGVCVNDVMLQVGQHDLPFGGVGASGMGHYHGYEGFATFSKLRPVFYQARFSALKFLAPKYGKIADRMISLILKTR